MIGGPPHDRVFCEPLTLNDSRNPACVLTDWSYDVGQLQEEFVGSHTEGELFMSIGGVIGDYNTDLMSSLLTKLGVRRRAPSM